MRVDIYCLIKIGDNNPSELGEAVLGELIKAVFSSTPSNVDKMQYINGGVDDYAVQGKTVMQVGITIEIVYETNIGDPYTSA